MRVHKTKKQRIKFNHEICLFIHVFFVMAMKGALHNLDIKALGIITTLQLHYTLNLQASQHYI